MQLLRLPPRRPTPPTVPGRAPPPHRLKLPPHGGTLTISIVENRASPKVGGGPARTPVARMLSELQLKAKLGSARPSDEVEGLKFEVKWEPMKGTLGAVIDQDESMAILGELLVVSCDYFVSRNLTCLLGIEQPRLRGDAAQGYQCACQSYPQSISVSTSARSYAKCVFSGGKSRFGLSWSVLLIRVWGDT